MKNKSIIKIIITCILLGIVLLNIDFTKFMAVLKQTHYGILMFSFSLGFPGICISTIKWKVLLNAQNIKNIRYIRLLALYHIGMFFSNFLPTEFGGDFVRSYIVGKEARKKTESFAATFMERLTGLIALIIIACAGYAINYDKANDAGLQFPIYVIICILLFFFIGIIKYRAIGAFLRRLISLGLFDKLVNKIDAFYDSTALYRHQKGVLLRVMILSFIFQLIPLVYVYFLLVSMHVPISFSYLVLIIPLITIIGLIPMTINSLGLREGAFVFLFSLFGLVPSEALVLSLLYRIGITIYGGIGGILYAMSDFRDVKILLKSKRGL